MAKSNSGAWGFLQNKVGGLVYRVSNGQNIVSVYQPAVKDPKTQNQISQRSKFIKASKGKKALDSFIESTHNVSRRSNRQLRNWLSDSVKNAFENFKNKGSKDERELTYLSPKMGNIPTFTAFIYNPFTDMWFINGYDFSLRPLDNPMFSLFAGFSGDGQFAENIRKIVKLRNSDELVICADIPVIEMMNMNSSQLGKLFDVICSFNQYYPNNISDVVVDPPDTEDDVYWEMADEYFEETFMTTRLVAPQKSMVQNYANTIIPPLASPDYKKMSGSVNLLCKESFQGVNLRNLVNGLNYDAGLMKYKIEGNDLTIEVDKDKLSFTDEFTMDDKISVSCNYVDTDGVKRYVNAKIALSTEVISAVLHVTPSRTAVIILVQLVSADGLKSSNLLRYFYNGIGTISELMALRRSKLINMSHLSLDENFSGICFLAVDGNGEPVVPEEVEEIEVETEEESAGEGVEVFSEGIYLKTFGVGKSFGKLTVKYRGEIVKEFIDFKVNLHNIIDLGNIEIPIVVGHDVVFTIEAGGSFDFSKNTKDWTLLKPDLHTLNFLAGESIYLKPVPDMGHNFDSFAGTLATLLVYDASKNTYSAKIADDYTLFAHWGV